MAIVAQILSCLAVLAAVAILGALGFFLSVVFYGKPWLLILAMLPSIALIGGPPAVASRWAFTWNSNNHHTAAVAIPAVMLVIAIPLCLLLLTMMEAAARP